MANINDIEIPDAFEIIFKELGVVFDKIVVYDDGPDELIKKLRQRISDGWQPINQIKIKEIEIMGVKQKVFSQAIYKKVK